jgi:prepilin-type N-terminal cleavage/methylation domain-containing protein
MELVVRRTSGFSLIEVLITMTIIAVMVGTGSMYYNDIMVQTNRDKALTDLKQICKVLADYDSELPQGITTYTDISSDVVMRDLNKLVEARKMTDVPDDPWGNIYRIDIQAGIIYSQGPDYGNSFDYYRYTVDSSHNPPLPLSIEQSISAAQDDVIVRFRPSFKPTHAKVVNTVRAGKEVSIISVMFTRPVTHTYLTTDTSFILTDPQGTAPPDITTTVVNVTQRHQVNLILADKLPILDTPPRYWVISAMADNSIQSTDTTTMEKVVEIDVVPAASY